MFKNVQKPVFISGVIFIILLAGLLFYLVSRNRQTKISAFGEYQGYSPVLYDGSRRTSAYMALADGPRLAYDLILPTQKGELAKEPLPVLFKYTPYLRTFTVFDRDGKYLLTGMQGMGWVEEVFLRLRYLLDKENGRYIDPLFRTKWLKDMLKHGYAVIVVERPGTGASFGVMDSTMEAVAREEDEILNWIAAQDWCDGNIGMYGDSWQAMVQITAASTGNPHLKAILPEASPIEMYQALEFPGGVYNKGFNSFVTSALSQLESLVTPVDADPDGKILAQAIEERQQKQLIKTVSKAFEQPFLDSVGARGTNVWRDAIDLYPFIERVNRANIPVYMSVGWYDIFTADMIFWYNNLDVPRRLTIRPLDHSQISESQDDLDYASEALRWFDYWLKGIDNGIMDEEPVHYYQLNASKAEAWQSASTWPLANEEKTAYYFGAGKSGSVASVNDGRLSTAAPANAQAFDAYKVDYTTTSGSRSRWTSVDETHIYPDMRQNDAKGLTYTSDPLQENLTVAGYPLVHLWLASQAPDLDAFVYLEMVDASGKSTYICEGILRASHRKTGVAPFDNLGLPYHTHKQVDLQPIAADQPIELTFGLLPTAFQFHKGERIRITVTFADADNFETPIVDPAPVVEMYRSGKMASYVELPLVD